MDKRLKDCLDRWSGNLPSILHEQAVARQRTTLSSIARICNLRYKRDNGDHWKTPDETWVDRGGDCEDIAILTGAMVRAVFPGIRIEFVLCRKVDTRIGHAILCIHGLDGPVYLDNEYFLYGEKDFDIRYQEHSRLEWPKSTGCKAV